jgi:molybdopterin-guanine dinucleotide biosynthesis protein A
MELPLPLTGVVLAGGQSRRLGRDKALLEFGGQALLARTVETLAPLCREVIVVTNSPQAHAHPAARLVGDLLPGMGSLGGIYTGLVAATTHYSLVVGCDMPFLVPEVIAYLASLAPGFDVIMPRRRTLNLLLLEPLLSIYSKPCLPFIKDLLDKRQLRIFDFLPHVRVRYVEESELAPWDPDHRSFLNINTPQDLAEVQALFEGAS